MASDPTAREHRHLPERRTQPPATAPTPCRRGHAPGALAFIVEDDVRVREALSNLLESIGLQTRTFASATELLSLELPAIASCFILDIRLPGLSGLDLQARFVAAHIRIPVIFLTAHADIPMAVKAMKAGALDFLTKPFREQEMLDAVTRAIERDAARLDDDRRTFEAFSRFATLSQREREVMELVTAGLMNKQAAERIGVAESTVKIHRAHVMRRMGARSLADLVRMADLLHSIPTPNTPPPDDRG